MITQNCASIGSLVHRAQGYKKLKEECLMASKFYVPGGSAVKTRSYYLVAENCRAFVKENNQIDFLEKGSLVVSVRSTRGPANELEVKVIDINNTINAPEEVTYRCSPDKLIKVNEKAWNLIATIESVADKIRIAKDTALCEELCSIDVGCSVVLYSSCIGLVTAKKSLKNNGMGVLFEVLIKDVFDDQRSSLTKIGNKVNVAADKLRLYQPSHKTSSKSKFLNDLNVPDNQYSYDFKDETDFVSQNHSIHKFKGGDSVMWLSESDPQPATICWNSRISDKVRIHLDNECQPVHCERSHTHLVPTRDLMLAEEFLKQYDEMLRKTGEFSTTYNINNQDPDISRVEDLLGLNELNEYFSNSGPKSPSNTKYDENSRKSSEKYSSSSTVSRKSESKLSSENENDLGIGSVVEVMIKDEPHYGVIKWIGNIDYQNGAVRPLIAGIELEEEHCEAGNGWMRGHKYFDCAPHRATFKLLNQCKKDSRFSEPSCSIEAFKDRAREVIPGIIEPVTHVDPDRTFRKYNGIQGHNNSCYLDATLFSMFTFTSVFDNLLLRPANANDCDCYEEVRRVLREEIVNPLRKNLFVHADSVMKLRTLLDNSTSVTGLTCEEKDPEEFLTSLVAQVLKAEPFLKLSSGHEAYYYQLFVEKNEKLILPTVQELFEQSLISSDIKLKEVPSCLIIQMPRFGKSYKMYPRILPSQLLDVTNVIENSPKECSVCGALAKYECKDCFKNLQHDDWWFSFCEKCVTRVHSHEDRRHHTKTLLQVPRECASFRDPNAIPRQYMELFAVLCIETSHYVAFVKCGSGPDTPWCFFDSMADRKGELNGFNIPEMVLCSELPNWLSENGVQEFSYKEDRNLPT